MTSPNTESVWDYPRPPRLEPTTSLIRIVHCGVLLAETTRALRILETSHPPVYYIPPADIALKYLRISDRRSSFCEFKGAASYWSVDVSAALTSNLSSQQEQLTSDLSSRPKRSAVERPAGWVTDAAWSYAHPAKPYAALADHLAFYASRVDECTVDGERVTAQPGDFYGGWITARITGPFKGPPGTLGW